MGKVFNHPTPTVINTELVPLDESFYIAADGQTEQWYYDNEAKYAPNRHLTPLTLTPKLSVKDKDTNISYGVDAGTVSFYTVQWYALEYADGGYVETAITNLTDSSDADYVLSGFNLIVKKNVSYSHGITIRCLATYKDPRDANTTCTTQGTVLLTTNRDAKVELPEVTIISPSARAFNPLTDYKTVDGVEVQDSLFDFEATVSNKPTGDSVIQYRVDGGGTEELVEEDGVMTALPSMDIRYPDGDVMLDQSFLYRITANGTKPNVSGMAFLTAMRGNTVKWNQLVMNGDFANGTVDWNAHLSTISVNNGVCTINRTASSSSGSILYQTLDISTTDKYYMSAVVKTADANYAMQLNFSVGASVTGNSVVSTTSTSFVKISQITSPATSTSTRFGVRLGNSSTPRDKQGYVKDVMLINLTLIFGTDAQIAAALGITTADITTATGVTAFETWLAQNVGQRDYCAYNAGSLVPTRFEAVKSTGFNVWDEEWEQGSINSTTGENATGSAIRSKNYIPVSPASYYLKAGNLTDEGVRVFYYDAEKNHISNAIWAGTIKTIPDNVCYIRFHAAHSLYGSTYNNDICINLSDPSRNGTYEAHWEATTPLSITSITGKLDGTGNSVVVFPEGMSGINNAYDELTIGGGAIVAKKRIQKTDLGDFTYTKHGDLYLTGSVTPASANMLVGKGDVSRWRQLLNNINDSTTSGYRSYYSGGTIYINNVSSETPKATNLSYFSGLPARVVVGHKYAIFADTDDYNAYLTINFGSNRNPYLGNTITFTSAPSSTIRLRINASIPIEILPMGGTISLKIGMFDLTDIFGVGNEPATVADFKSWLTTHAGTTDCFTFLANGIAITNAGTYADAEAFKSAMSGVHLYYELATPQEYILDPVQDPYIFEWFGISGNQEVKADTLPWYVSGQGTPRLTVDAMFGEHINVVAAARMLNGQISPSRAYAAVTWRIPDVDTHVMSAKGGTVRNESDSFTFETICNVKGQMLSENVKNEHLRFNWKWRRSDSTTENDAGWGQSVTMPSANLINVRTVAGKLPSTHVYPYPFLLGAWEPQTSAATVPYSQPTLVKDGITYVRTIN